MEWFWDTLKATGLEPLYHTNYSIIDSELLTSFIEICHPEMSTFHLPVGELGHIRRCPMPIAYSYLGEVFKPKKKEIK
jgi:hypothetical protein